MVTTFRIGPVAAALFPLMFGCSSTKPTSSAPAPAVTPATPATHIAPAAPAPAPMPADHDHMAGMSMSMPMSIPKGALYTAADVEVMQGMIARHARATY